MMVTCPANVLRGAGSELAERAPRSERPLTELAGEMRNTVWKASRKVAAMRAGVAAVGGTAGREHELRGVSISKTLSGPGS